MKEPWSNKSEGMKDALKGMFPDHAKNISEKKCATCGSDKTGESDFKNDISRKEYTISGMCQVCQDKVFKLPSQEDEDEEKWLSEHQKTCTDPKCMCRHY